MGCLCHGVVEQTGVKRNWLDCLLSSDAACNLLTVNLQGMEGRKESPTPIGTHHRGKVWSRLCNIGHLTLLGLEYLALLFHGSQVVVLPDPDVLDISVLTLNRRCIQGLSMWTRRKIHRIRAIHRLLRRYNGVRRQLWHHCLAQSRVVLMPHLTVFIPCQEVGGLDLSTCDYLIDVFHSSLVKTRPVLLLQNHQLHLIIAECFMRDL